MALSVRFDFNRAQVMSVAGDAGEFEVDRLGNRVLNSARSKADVDTGRLRGSINMNKSRTGDTVSALIGTNLEYAIFVHEGTGIYGPRGAPITPRNGRFLAWPAINNSGRGNRRYSGGRTSNWVFARSVRGRPANPFMLDAFREVMGSAR